MNRKELYVITTRHGQGQAFIEGAPIFDCEKSPDLPCGDRNGEEKIQLFVASAHGLGSLGIEIRSLILWQQTF